MYYINSFIIYSVIGFIMESTIYKFMDSKRHSGIMFGPVTIVYGVGALICMFLHDYLNKLKISKLLKIIIYILLTFILLTLVEFIFGHLTSILFDIDLWDYTNKKYNIGKYICLEISIMWSILSLIFIYIIKPFFDKHIEIINKYQSYFFVILFIIDLIATIIIKI